MNRLEPNSFKNLNEYIVANPYRVDIAVKSLQAAFKNNLTWLEKSFPRAVRRVKKIESGNNVIDRIFPAIRTQDGNDEADLMELDNESAYSFFYQPDTETSIDFEEFSNFNVYEVPLRAIFWMNLNFIDPDRGDDFLPELTTEVLKVILNTVYEDVDGTYVRGVEINDIYQEPQNIFEGFSFNLVDTQFLHYPNRGLRVDMTVTISETCQIV